MVRASMSPRPAERRKPKPKEAKQPPSRYAPAAFLKGSAEAVRELCEELATIAHERFSDLTGTTWTDTGLALASQLRAAGHDLSSFDESDELQEWQVTYYHPRGTFTLSLVFRAPTAVEVTWLADGDAITARR
jgi:hypothetical protein